jgi:formylglycine-generating enzyme required for sulfatase activity
MLINFSFFPPKAYSEEKSSIFEKEQLAGEEREFEIAQDMKMIFCWIPKGEARLGSTETESNIVRNLKIDRDILEMLPEESEIKLGFFKTEGFWMGKYEVTQAEWKIIMHNNPSYFQVDGEMGDKLQQEKIEDTNRYPVENVRKETCQKFLERVNKRGGKVSVFGKPGKFCLPYEDEWEYACRGDKGNKRAFYWGNELNGTQANSDGDLPFGTEQKGQSLGRTCAVDFSNRGQYEKHPWGLCHIIGNVSELCDSKDASSKDSIIRGGDCCYAGWACRSAYRDRNIHAGRYYIGFRVCYRLD